MPIVEYKNIKTYRGIQKPPYIHAGGVDPDRENKTLVGYINENPEYWIPPLKVLSKEDFIERRKRISNFEEPEWEDDTTEEEKAQVMIKLNEALAIWEDEYDNLLENWKKTFGE